MRTQFSLVAPGVRLGVIRRKLYLSISQTFYALTLFSITPGPHTYALVQKSRLAGANPHIDVCSIHKAIPPAALVALASQPPLAWLHSH